MTNLAVISAHVVSCFFMFDMVCAMLSSLELLGPRFESIGPAEVDWNWLLLLLVLLLLLLLLLLLPLLMATVQEVVVVTGCARLARGSVQLLPGDFNVNTHIPSINMLKRCRALWCAIVFCFANYSFGAQHDLGARHDHAYSLCAMFRANPVCGSDTMFCGVPKVLCI